MKIYYIAMWLKELSGVSQKSIETDFFLAISKVELAIVVEGDPKATFSIGTTPRWRGWRYSFPLIVPFYPWYVPYNGEC